MKTSLHARGCKTILRKEHIPSIPSAVCHAGDVNNHSQVPVPSRRTVLASTLAASALLAPGSAQAFFGLFEEAAKEVAPTVPGFGVLENDQLAYKFLYPTQTANGKTLPMAFSRAPEKYSSAAPLNTDARQRIVAEIVSLSDAVTCAVYVGPASGYLENNPVEDWTALKVATAVLTDKSTARNTYGTRIPLASIEESSTVEKNGVTYYVYETLQQGSPNMLDNSRDTFRRSLCATAVRAGQDGTNYLYTLSFACPEKTWDGLDSAFHRGVDSFELLTPGKSFVSPDSNPWLFF